jgi:hypothetical protein
MRNQFRQVCRRIGGLDRRILRDGQSSRKKHGC